MDVKAKEEMTKGEKALKAWFGGEEKYEKAREHFGLGGNFYKANQQWLEAASAYTRCQEMSVKLKEEMQAAEDMQNAAMCFKKANDPRAKEYLERVIETYVKNGKASMASKLAISMGEMYEVEADPKSAAQWFNRAVDLLKRENSLRTAQQLQIRVAGLYALSGSYKEAISIYEEVGKDYAADRLLKLSARRELFMAALCHLTQIKPVNKDEGLEAFMEIFHMYEDVDPIFTSQTWEHILLTKIVEAFTEDSMEKYANAVSEYEDINPLDELKSKLLMRIKDVLRKIVSNEC